MTLVVYISRMKPHPDIIGKRFGKLTVIERVGSKRISAKTTESLWRCVCDCGGERITIAGPLKYGRTTSCGCGRYDRSPRLRHGHAGNAHHGIKPTSTYTIWRGMVVRCTKPNTANFQQYGGRGITVCERWTTFDNFLTDMGERPSRNHSLDRIDGSGNYEPSNCRWATAIEQQTNRAVVRRITYRDKTYSLAALARFAGCSEEVLRSRIKAGWSIKDAVETPVRLKRKSARQTSSRPAFPT